MDIVKFLGTIGASIPDDISEEDEEMVEYAIHAYGHCLQSGAFSFAEFAKRISEVYSLENPVNKAVCEVLERI